MISAAEFMQGSSLQNFGSGSVLVTFVITIVALVFWAIVEWRNHRPQLAVLVISALLSCLGDAGASMLVMLRAAPEVSGPVLYRAFDAEATLVTSAPFPVYLSTVGYLAYRAFEQRWTRRRFWLVFSSIVFADIAFEYLMLRVFDLYSYAGNQTLQLFGLPLLWPMTYVATSVLLGAVLYLLRRYLRGRRMLLAIPMLASGYLGFPLLLCWPALVALHADIGPVPRLIAGIAGVGCLVTTVYALTSLLDRTDVEPARGRVAYQGGPRVREQSCGNPRCRYCGPARRTGVSPALRRCHRRRTR
ncbi:hypothetical protein ABZ942_29705 [Nocardia sp. NPDC046473]|uniref:hypothetical protein n=1 Tax=Nocardia sp. NPDC046473 TaxID=3155733 RepID=UPI0033DA3741